MASLQHNDKHFCGATLLFEDWNTLRWALTSAYCASQYEDNLSIRAGAVNISSGGEVYDIKTIIIHPEYDPESYDNDIALIQTAEKVWADYTTGTFLPRADNRPNDMDSITVLGWGKTNDDNEFSEVLQMVQMPYRTIDHCRNCYSEMSITENMFCAGWTETSNTTSCEGDYGGPGMGVGVIYGIQSWGKSCGVGKYPTVFTTVVDYLDWIEDNTGIKPM